MILPVLQNTKRYLFLSTLCLTVALSSSFSAALMASKNDPLIENEDKSLKRTRSDGNENNNNNNGEVECSLEVGRPSKRQKTETSSVLSTDLFLYNDPSESLWIPDEIVSHFFMNISFKDIRAGRCVSEAWQQLLTSDDFCTIWGQYFSPSTPKAMGMTPQEFIRYWSTPSFAFLDNEKSYRDMFADDLKRMSSATHYDANGHKQLVVVWKNGEITPLPYLNNGRFAEANSINKNRSIIVGSATDGANNDQWTAVQWINGEILPLPYLNNGDNATAISVNDDGSIIAGEVTNNVNDLKQTAVIWNNGEIFSVQELLESAGLDLGENHHLISTRKISSNGLQVVCTGHIERIIGTNETFGIRETVVLKAILPSKYTE